MLQMTWSIKALAGGTPTRMKFMLKVPKFDEEADD